MVHILDKATSDKPHVFILYSTNMQTYLHLYNIIMIKLIFVEHTPCHNHCKYLLTWCLLWYLAISLRKSNNDHKTSLFSSAIRITAACRASNLNSTGTSVIQNYLLLFTKNRQLLLKPKWYLEWTQADRMKC